MGSLALRGYQFQEKIGEGGMACVYRGHQESLSRPVAIKVLNQQMRKHSQVYEAFEREAVIIARLNHPNIIHVIDRGMTAEGTPYFIMEFIDGVDLSTLIRKGQLADQKKIEICLQIGKALAYAHKNGVIHRDIKPGNVIVDDDFNCKVLDFGIALFYEGESEGLQDGSERDIMGTLNYMAPELSASAVQATYKSDIYSLGVLMHELFSGELPIYRSDSEPLPGAIPKPVASLIKHCLAPEPARRPNSMMAVTDQLLVFLHGSHLDKQRARKATESVNQKKTFSLLDIVYDSPATAVYVFIEKHSGQQLVVKKCNIQEQADSYEVGKRLSTLGHQHIVRVHGVSKNQRSFIVVMDYLKGGNLEERLARPYDLPRFLRLARQICRALAFAHKHQIIHGNLRPSNILFDENERALISDFGFPHHIDNVEITDKHQREFANACQIAGEPQCPQTDIYAAGVIFYLLLISNLPRFRDGVLQEGRAFRRLPAPLQRMLRNMLKQQLCERTNSTAEILSQLEQINDDMSTELWAKETSPPTPGTRQKRTRWPWILALGMILAVANVVLIVSWQGQPSDLTNWFMELLKPLESLLSNARGGI